MTDGGSESEPVTGGGPEPILERFQRALEALGSEPYTLTLFVSGASDASALAITNIREICDEHLIGRHRLSIIDLNQEPDRAAEHHVLATPTLVKDRPLPSRMLVGDMSDHVRILLALDVTDTNADAPMVAEA
jgi:circadian clock protein KaiB